MRGEDRALERETSETWECGGELPVSGALLLAKVIPVTDYGERPVFSCGGTRRVQEGQLRSLTQKRRRSK